ncbi:MAG TPA: enoyl-ACP reductase [Aggregatilinea sp.]|uniref:enoyl-ACP reductase FabI n=1 Tax=Aggregatilinea sp. TaxID=2806333 RepID=UPI002BD7AF89|nr:enoyl-ACP reductase [Aggregatilinea sp.]HML25068.1 enoyl-ACP reductase [Aggregatilinea sp.]
MGLLDGKTALVFGVANNRSIAWGITQALVREGAAVGLSYATEALEKRVFPLAKEAGIDFVEKCDVTSDEQIEATFGKVRDQFGKLDILVHAVAFAPGEELGGRFRDVTRDGFKLALDISAYSLIPMAKYAADLMPDGGSIMALSYYAAAKVMPRYNVMAIAKAALENIVRYLAADLGPQGIRVNTLSPGPIKTLAAAGVPGFRTMLNYSEKVSPMRELVTQEDVGNAAAFLASDWAKNITGETLYIDGGYNVLGLTATEEDL